MVCKCGCAEGKECTCKDCPDKKGCHKGEVHCCCESKEKTTESEKTKECSKCAPKWVVGDECDSNWDDPISMRSLIVRRVQMSILENLFTIMCLMRLNILFALQIGLHVYAFTVSLKCDQSSMDVIISSADGFYGVVRSLHRSECSVKGDGQRFVALAIPLDDGTHSQCGVVEHDGAYVTLIDIRTQPNVETDRDCTILIRCPLDSPLQRSLRPYQFDTALADAHLAVTNGTNAVDVMELHRTYTLGVNILKTPENVVSIGQCIAFSDESNSLRMLQLTDSDGCSASHEIVDGFEELTDANSVHSRWQTQMQILKFNDSSYFFIQCQIVARRDHIERYSKERCGRLSVDTVGLLEPTELISTIVSRKMLISAESIRQLHTFNSSDGCNKFLKKRLIAYTITLFLAIITAAVWIFAFMKRPSNLQYTAPVEPSSSEIITDEVQGQSRGSTSRLTAPNCSSKKCNVFSGATVVWNDESSNSRDYLNRSYSPLSPSTQLNEITAASDIVNARQCNEQNEHSGTASTLDDICISEPFSQLHSQPPPIRNGTLDRPMKRWPMEQGISSRWRTPSCRKHVEKEIFPGDRRISDATLTPRDELLQFDRPEAVISIIDSVFTGSLVDADHMNVLRSVHMDIKRLESDECCPRSADAITTPFIGRREMIERISKRDTSRQNFGPQLSNISAMNPVLLDDEDSASNRPSDASSWRYLNPEALALQAKETIEVSSSDDLNSKSIADSNRFTMRLKGNKTFYEI